MDQRTTFWTDHVAAAKLVSIPTSAYAREHNISVAALYYRYLSRKLVRF